MAIPKDREPSAVTPAAPQQPAPGEASVMLFKPKPGVHLTQLGTVALENWVGRIGNRRVRVYRGASAKDLPPEVVKRMQADGIAFGSITFEELGLRKTVAVRGATLILPDTAPEL